MSFLKRSQRQPSSAAASELKRLRDELADIPRRREAILAASTARKLQLLAEEERGLVGKVQEAERVCNRIVAETPLPQRYGEVVEAIRASLLAEQHVVSDLQMIGARAIPTKYIRADATEFFKQEIDDAQARIAEINAIHLRPNVSLGPRLIHERDQLETIVREWPQQAKLCAAGEKLFKIRQTRQELEAERDQLQQEHRNAALAVA